MTTETQCSKFKTMWDTLCEESNAAKDVASQGLTYLSVAYFAARKNTGRLLSDGFYDLTGLEFCVVDGQEGYVADRRGNGEATANAAIRFMETYPDFVVAHGYQTNAMIFVSARPPQYSSEVLGSDIGRGACTVFTSCPQTLLMVAEDD